MELQEGSRQHHRTLKKKKVKNQLNKNSVVKHSRTTFYLKLIYLPFKNNLDD